MATSPNPFDQFDSAEPNTQTQSANPFDQFDNKPAPTRGNAGGGSGAALEQRNLASVGIKPYPEQTAMQAINPFVSTPQKRAENAGIRTPEQEKLIRDNPDTPFDYIPIAPIGRLASKAVDTAVEAARKAGYVLPPSQAGKGEILEGLSGGKIKTSQLASVKNQDVTNKLAKEELRLPSGKLSAEHDEPLTNAHIEQFRKEHYEAGYKPLEELQIPLNYTPKFRKSVDAIGGDYSTAGEKFPGIVKSKEVEEIKKELLSTQSMTSMEAIHTIRALRDKASRWFNSPDANSRATAKAMKKASDAIEGLIDQNLTAIAKDKPEVGKMLDNYRTARTNLAKSYDIQKALTPSGDIDAATIEKSAKKRPLSGGLKTIANARGSFPKALQSKAKIGGVPTYSPLDQYAIASELAAGFSSGHAAPGIGAAFLQAVRPLARKAILSEPYQNRFIGGASPTKSLSLSDFSSKSGAAAATQEGVSGDDEQPSLKQYKP